MPGAAGKINTIQYVNDKSYLEVKYDYVDCNYQWIHYARYGLDILGSNVDYWSGKQQEPGHYSAMFAKIPSIQNFTISPDDAYSQFIPICTSKDVTSFDYGVKTGDEEVIFDVYFVPSIDERVNYHTNGNFTHYSSEECYGKGFSNFGGSCNDVDRYSGLLIVIPDNLEKPLTKISVKLKEN